MLVQNIQARCKLAGISISALEKAVGLGNGVISRWDASSPRLENVQIVAKYFGVSVDDLTADHENNTT